MPALADAPLSPAAFWLADSLTTGSDWTDAASAGPPNLLSFLRRQYQISPDALKVLRERTGLLWHLVEARGQIEQSFGRLASVRLEVVRDPDVENGPGQVVGLISSSLSLDDAATALDDLDGRWTLVAASKLEDRVMFDLAF